MAMAVKPNPGRRSGWRPATYRAWRRVPDTSGAIIETPLGTMQGHYEMSMKMASLSASTFPYSDSPFPTHSLKEYGDIPYWRRSWLLHELIALLHKVEFTPGKDTLW